MFIIFSWYNGNSSSIFNENTKETKYDNIKELYVSSTENKYDKTKYFLLVQQEINIIKKINKTKEYYILPTENKFDKVKMMI
jgi:hypothetical protein